MQDLHSTDPTQEACATVVHHADCSGPIQEDELDRTRSRTRVVLKYIDHAVAIDDLSHVCNGCNGCNGCIR